MASIYRKHLLRRILVAPLLTVIAFALAGAIGLIVASNNGPLPPGKIAGSIVLAGAALGLLWWAVVELTYKVTLTRDGIVVSYPGSKRALAYTEIAGRRETRRRDGRLLTIVPIDPRAKPLRLQAALDTDHSFESWFAGLRDLDAEDIRTSEAAIMTDQAYGSTPEERRDRLDRARTIMKAMNIAAVIAAVWCLFEPVPYLAAIGVTIALPLLALAVVATSRGLVRFARSPTEAYALAAGVPIFCTAALAIRIYQDAHLIDWPSALYIGCGVGLALFAVSAIADRRLLQRVLTLGIAAVVAIAYGIATVAFADIHLDNSAGLDFRSQVLDAHVSRGKVSTYFVKLAPWGPWQGGDVSVPETMLNRLTLDRVACIHLHDGTFGIRWFAVDACPAGTISRAPPLNTFDQIAPGNNPFGPPPVTCPSAQETLITGLPLSMACRRR